MNVLFVCLGNICRSPIAEAVLAHLVAARPDAQRWTVDSAGTGAWHVGKRPDPRALAVLAEHGLDTAHRARQIAPGDFAAFDRILAMDHQNLAELERFRPRRASAGPGAAVALLGAWAEPPDSDVPDPYYRDVAAFRAVYDLVEVSCRRFLEAHPPA